jgi:hypothetical protein
MTHLLIKSLIIICISIFSHSIYANIEYKEVQVKGAGASLQEAINNGLVEAIGRVNGKSIDAKNQLNQLSQTTRVNDEKSRFSQKEIQKAYKEATKGVVASYDVLSEQQIDNGRRWQVIVKAKIAKYKRAANSNRKRLAVIPFRVSDQSFLINSQPVNKEQVNRILGQNMVSQLVQSRRFTVLDREYIQEVTGEKNIILSGNTPMEEMAKLGEELVADYIVVGTLENIGFSENEIHMSMTNRTIKTYQGNVELSYRIIDVPTKQIKFSDFARFTLTPDDFSKVDQGMNLENAESAICIIAADKISKKILNAIYPMLVVSVRGNSVTLNQGGEMLKNGDRYEVFQYGERMYDPYTKESIGREEQYIGEIEITRVNPKSSQARIINADIEFSQVFAPKKLVCRLKEEAASPAKKKIEDMRKRFEEKKKKRDEEW